MLASLGIGWPSRLVASLDCLVRHYRPSSNLWWQFYYYLRRPQWTLGCLCKPALILLCPQFTMLRSYRRGLSNLWYQWYTPHRHPFRVDTASGIWPRDSNHRLPWGTAMQNWIWYELVLGFLFNFDIGRLSYKKKLQYPWRDLTSSNFQHWARTLGTLKFRRCFFESTAIRLWEWNPSLPANRLDF